MFGLFRPLEEVLVFPFIEILGKYENPHFTLNHVQSILLVKHVTRPQLLERSVQTSLQVCQDGK
jgi:hypothetical protein